MSYNVPILFLIYNRQQTTSIVLDAIRRVRPTRLFVAADGPSDEREDDHSKCQKARNLIANIDWDCDVKTLYRDHNLGCRAAVSSAINWFFDHVEEGIILEDDCLPSASFFRYCQEMLEYYRSDERVMAISGDNFQDDHKVSDDSYYFSRYPHCWGWATWRRAWEKYDSDMSGWPEFLDSPAFSDIGASDPLFRDYWVNNFKGVYSGTVDTWDSVWTFSCWSNLGLTALPVRNLVKNIGFGPEATHTLSENPHVSAMSAAELNFPLRHPAEVVRNAKADNYTDMYHYGFLKPPKPFMLSRAINKMKQLFA